MEHSYNSHNWISHFWCRKYKYHLVYTHHHKNEALDIIIEANNQVKNIYKSRISFIRLDGERTLGNDFDNWCIQEGIYQERVAYPDTPEQNPTEASGKILSQTSRQLQIASNLPVNL